jgi:RNA polymerase sigma-70 factor (ECF subfamily)
LDTDDLTELPLRSGRSDRSQSALETETSAWMRAAQAGDTQAFDLLARRLRRRAFRVAHGLVGSREDALELTQETFLKVWSARDTWRPEERFLPWFHRVLRNACFSALRRAGRIRQKSVQEGAAADESGEWELADPGPGPGQPAERSERADLLRAAFQTLSPKDREILALRHFEELSYAELAEALGIKIGTVMSRLFHARRRLREALEPFLGPGGGLE